MPLKTLRERIKKVKASLERSRAKHHGLTVPEYRELMKKRKAEKRAFKADLRKKERLERQKFEKWKIEQKYKQKRKAHKQKKGKGLMEGLLGDPGASKGGDPLGIFGPPSRPKKRKRKKRKR